MQEFIIDCVNNSVSSGILSFLNAIDETLGKLQILYDGIDIEDALEGGYHYDYFYWDEIYSKYLNSYELSHKYDTEETIIEPEDIDANTDDFFSSIEGDDLEEKKCDSDDSLFLYTVKEIYGDNIPKPKPPPKSLPENYLYYDYCGFSCIYPNKLTVTRNIPMLAIKSTPEKLYPDTVLLLYEKTERQFKARMNDKLESIKYGENHKEMFREHYSQKTICIGDCQYAWKGKEILFYDYDSYTNKYSFNWNLFLEANNRYFCVNISFESLSSVKEIYEGEAIWRKVLNSFVLDPNSKSFIRIC